MIELVAVGIGGGLQVVKGPEPEFHGGRERAGAGAGTLGSDAAQVVNPLFELRKEQLVGHGNGKLQALHRLRALVGGFELRVHPFLSEEARAILRDSVAAHEADGFPHHVGAVTGVPELAGRAKDVSQGIEDDKLQERVLAKLGEPILVPLPFGLGGKRQVLDGVGMHRGQSLVSRAARQLPRGHVFILVLLQRVELVE